MTYRQAFVDAVRRLGAGGVPTQTPELDARVLLAWVAGVGHAGLLARWPDPVSPLVEAAFEDALVRRLAGEPVAWITGFKEFLGMEFEVGPGLLVPRADTETLVEAGLEVLSLRTQGGVPRVVDVCTGTGCVAVGLSALSHTPLEVWAGDLSPLAVDTARRNAERLLAPGRMVVVESDLLESLPGSWDLIVSNPPYLTPEETSERVERLGWKEPSLALDGGGDGLDLIRRLVVQASARLVPGGWFLTEAADAQMPLLEGILTDAGLAKVRLWKDLGSQRRVIGGSSPNL